LFVSAVADDKGAGPELKYGAGYRDKRDKRRSLGGYVALISATAFGRSLVSSFQQPVSVSLTWMSLGCVTGSCARRKGTIHETFSPQKDTRHVRRFEYAPIEQTVPRLSHVSLTLSSFSLPVAFGSVSAYLI